MIKTKILGDGKNLNYFEKNMFSQRVVKTPIFLHNLLIDQHLKLILVKKCSVSLLK